MDFKVPSVALLISVIGLGLTLNSISKGNTERNTILEQKMKLLVDRDYKVISSPENALAREKINSRIREVEKDVEILKKHH
jgi:hypothetical protein